MNPTRSCLISDGHLDKNRLDERRAALPTFFGVRAVDSHQEFRHGDRANNYVAVARPGREIDLSP